MRITVFVFSLLLLLDTPAEAYVDPGTGSMVMQLLIGGAMAGLVLFRAGLRRMIGWFRRPFRGG
jgi:hypothetical protein